MHSLSRSDPGSTCTIKWMFGAPEAVTAMRSMDLKEGSVIRVIRKYRDCLIIGNQGRRIVLGKEVADRIQV